MTSKSEAPNNKVSVKKQATSKREACEAVKNRGIGKLRNARNKTQVAVAKHMNVYQSAVCRIERQRDCQVRTLQRYIAALGGRLEMHAVFPDEKVDISQWIDEC